MRHGRTVRVPHVLLKNHFRRVVREVGWKLERSGEDSAFIKCVRRPFEADPPGKKIAIIVQSY